MTRGIYRLKNLESGRVYLGRSEDIEERERLKRSGPRNGNGQLGKVRGPYKKKGVVV